MTLFRSFSAALLGIYFGLASQACAQAPAGGQAPPPPIATTVPQGTLVIAGGGKLPEEIYRAFVEASGGKGAHIAVLPSASGEARESAQAMVDRLNKLGAQSVVVDPKNRAEADASAAWDTVKACTGFWFTGGDQKRIHDKVVGTHLHRLILDAYRHGAAVGGTSAGAAAMTSIMIEGASDVSSPAPGTYRTLQGLGLLPGAIVDQHFLKRSRHNRLFSLLIEHPDHLGLGVDESTAIVVKDGRIRVLGEGSVLALDPADMEVRGSGFRHLRVHLLGSGQGLDLATRKLLP